jgi:hypothetical protein
MADVNLSPRQLAGLLDKVDDALKTVSAVREELIRAMAARRRPPSSTNPVLQSRRIKRR